MMQFSNSFQHLHRWCQNLTCQNLNIIEILPSVNQRFKMTNDTRRIKHVRSNSELFGKVTSSHNQLIWITDMPGAYLISALRNALNTFTLQTCNGHAIRILIRSSKSSFRDLVYEEIAEGNWVDAQKKLMIIMVNANRWNCNEASYRFALDYLTIRAKARSWKIAVVRYIDSDKFAWTNCRTNSWNRAVHLFASDR